MRSNVNIDSCGVDRLPDHAKINFSQASKDLLALIVQLTMTEGEASDI